MVTHAVDRSNEFREAVQARDRSLPDAKRQKRVHRPSSPGQADVWTREAARVAGNIDSLATFLRTIRRAYLDLSTSSSAGLRGAAAKRPRTLDPAAGLEAWADVRWLTDRERDEVDLQTKAVLRRCMDRVRDLEAVEKARQAKLTAEQPAGRVGRLLGIPLATSSPGADQLKAHRASVILYLTNALAAVGHAQQAQQEARVQRQMERTGGGGLGGLGNLGADALGAARGDVHVGDRKAGKANATDIPALYMPAPLPPDEDDGEPPIEDLLTADQVQQFEAEASSLLRATQDQLAALRTAEASLLEIGALQSELAHHLTAQAELTDQLWEDAVTVTGRVEEGNKQLKRARERNRESRIFLLVFLIGASLTLLFLDRY